MAVRTDRQILDEIQYHLVEAPDQGATFPSGLWSAAEALNALNRAQENFVHRARTHVARAPYTLAAAEESVDLGAAGGWEDVMQVVLLELELAAGTFHEIPPTDTFEADHATPTWSTAAAAQAVPNAYSVHDQPTLTIRLIPASDVGGTLWIHYIPRPWALDRVGSGSGETLMVQDGLTLGVKWGALATLLGKPGRAHDPQRAQYCRQRMDEIVELSKLLVMGG